MYFTLFCLTLHGENVKTYQVSQNLNESTNIYINNV